MFHYFILGDRRSTVVKVLCYKSEGRWFDPSLCQGSVEFFVDIKSFDSASNRNEYQQHLLGVKATGTIRCRCHEIWEP